MTPNNELLQEWHSWMVSISSVGKEDKDRWLNRSSGLYCKKLLLLQPYVYSDSTAFRKLRRAVVYATGWSIMMRCPAFSITITLAFGINF